MSAEDIKLNDGKEPSHLKLHYFSYEVEGDEYEEECTIVDSTSGMDVGQDVTLIEFKKHIYLNFYAADLAQSVKRSSEDKFSEDLVVDELAKAMKEDAKLGGSGRKKTKRGKHKTSSWVMQLFDVTCW